MLPDPWGRVHDRGSGQKRRRDSESSPIRPRKRSTREEFSPDLSFRSREPESDEDVLHEDQPQDDDPTDEPQPGPSSGPFAALHLLCKLIDIELYLYLTTRLCLT